MAENGSRVAEVSTKNRSPVLDERDAESSSFSSGGDAQAGVKGIEAISQTWTQWALIMAYVG